MITLVGALTCAHARGVKLTVDYSAAYTKCRAAPDATTASLIECTDAELRRWDTKLNDVYGQFMTKKGLSANARAELRDAQHAWIAARDKICRANGDLEAEGGTLAPLVALGCALDMTAQRASDLDDFAYPDQ